MAHDFCAGQALLLPGIFEPAVRPARLIAKRGLLILWLLGATLDPSCSAQQQEVVEQNVSLRKALRQVEERSGSRSSGFLRFGCGFRARVFFRLLPGAIFASQKTSL